MSLQVRALFRLAWEKGLNPVPTKDKKPLIAWGEYIYRKMTLEEFEEALRMVRNEFAILTGQQVGSKFLVVVDIDEPIKFPIMIPPYATKTKRGYHIPYYSNFPLASQKIDGIEIRGIASLVMFPGSIVDGHLYHGNPYHYFNPPHPIPRAILNLFKGEKNKKKKVLNKIPNNIALDNPSEIIDEIKELAKLIRPFYVIGRRHNIAMGVAALLKRKQVPINQALALFRMLPDNEDRTPQIIATYSKNYDEIASYFWCPEVIEAIWQTDIIERLVRKFAESS